MFFKLMMDLKNYDYPSISFANNNLESERTREDDIVHGITKRTDSFTPKTSSRLVYCIKWLCSFRDATCELDSMYIDQSKLKMES